MTCSWAAPCSAISTPSERASSDMSCMERTIARRSSSIGVVVAAEHLEQLVRADAPAGHARAQLPQLRLQQRMQAPHREIAHVHARRRMPDAARSGRGGIRALVGGSALGGF